MAVLRSQLDRVQGETAAAVDFKVINAALIILFPSRVVEHGNSPVECQNLNRKSGNM